MSRSHRPKLGPHPDPDRVPDPTMLSPTQWNAIMQWFDQHRSDRGMGEQTQPTVARAPGRVNLIGEHTDYNDGFVLPVAIDREIVVAGWADPELSHRSLHLFSLDLDQPIHAHLDALEPTAGSWGNYPLGVIKLMAKAGFPVQGSTAVYSGTIPVGAGLSSSAALEVATATLVETLFPRKPPLSAPAIAKLCQRAENEFVGVNCGIMDQFISKLGVRDHALFLDCRSLEYEQVPLELRDTTLLVCNSMVQHSLAESAYNTRRRECERGVEILRELVPHCNALRDIDAATFEQHRDALPTPIDRRVEHVVCENERVCAARHALYEDDLEHFGKLMNASHTSLRDRYEVSCEELDALVAFARDAGAIGARMTGGGFGGCTVNLVPDETVERFEREVVAKYRHQFGFEPTIYAFRVAEGATIVDTEPLGAGAEATTVQ